MHQPSSESNSVSSSSSGSSIGRLAAIPGQWFRRWFEKRPAPERTKPQKARKVDAIQLEDRILYSASPLLAFLDPFAEQVQPVQSDENIQMLNDLLTELMAASSQDAIVIESGSQSIIEDDTGTKRDDLED
jgi:hypothetical protein